MHKAKIMNFTRRRHSSLWRAQLWKKKKRVDNLQPQGWALRSTKKISRFNPKQKSSQDENFKISEQTGKKADPEDVARDMRYAQEMVAESLQQLHEFLSLPRTYYPRLSASKFVQ